MLMKLTPQFSHSDMADAEVRRLVEVRWRVTGDDFDAVEYVRDSSTAATLRFRRVISGANSASATLSLAGSNLWSAGTLYKLAARWTSADLELGLDRRFHVFSGATKSAAAGPAGTPTEVAGDLSLADARRYVERLQRFRYGPGVFKVDWALDGPIPWRAPECTRAATLHLGGTLEEIAAEMGMPVEKVEPIPNLVKEPLSLETPISDGEDTCLGDLVKDERSTDPEKAVLDLNLKEETRRILATLSPREEKIIRMRFGIREKSDYTLEETGKVFGVTRERIRQIEAKALQRIQKHNESERLRDYLK